MWLHTSATIALVTKVDFVCPLFVCVCADLRQTVQSITLIAKHSVHYTMTRASSSNKNIANVTQPLVTEWLDGSLAKVKRHALHTCCELFRLWAHECVCVCAARRGSHRRVVVSSLSLGAPQNIAVSDDI